MIRLTFDLPAGSSGVEEEKLFELSEGSCFDFHKEMEHLFVVGTEEGRIYKCSKAYNNEYLLTFEVYFSYLTFKTIDRVIKWASIPFATTHSTAMFSYQPVPTGR